MAKVDWQLEPTAWTWSEKEVHEIDSHKTLNDLNSDVNCESRSIANEYRLENKEQENGGKSRTSTPDSPSYVPEERGMSDTYQHQDLLKPSYDM
jgi:hypothetical protein